MLCGLNLNKCSRLGKVCNNSLTAFHKVHTCVLTCFFVHITVIGHNIKNGKVATKTNFEVIGVVSRCDFNSTCTLVHLCIGVSNDGDFSADYRDNNSLTNKAFISFVVRVYCNCSITGDCFGTGCSYDNFTCAVSEGISEVPEVAVFFFIFNLSIGD